MLMSDLKGKIPDELYNVLKTVNELRPCQEKAIKEGLLDNKNLLVCTPTASGKTLVAEIACLNNILTKKKKAVYIVPLKALASEKYRDFLTKYKHLCKIAVSTGDLDSEEKDLKYYDLIICTAEKFDSFFRHSAQWLNDIGTIIVDEVHLLNDPERGPTVEIIITMSKMLLKKSQLICLSATIGNTKDLAKWLNAKLITDSWRPVKLYQGIYLENKIEFKE